MGQTRHLRGKQNDDEENSMDSRWDSGDESLCECRVGVAVLCNRVGYSKDSNRCLIGFGALIGDYLSWTNTIDCE